MVIILLLPCVTLPYYWFCFSACLSKHRLWPLWLFQGGGGRGSVTAAGLKHPETWRSVWDTSVNRKRWRVSVCIMCMHVCVCVWGAYAGGWAFSPPREMALHHVYTAYLPVNLQKPRSAQTAYGGWPVRPRRQMPDTRAWTGIHTLTRAHTQTRCSTKDIPQWTHALLHQRLRLCKNTHTDTHSEKSCSCLTGGLFGGLFRGRLPWGGMIGGRGGISKTCSLIVSVTSTPFANKDCPEKKKNSYTSSVRNNVTKSRAWH